MTSVWQSASPLLKTIATCTALEMLLFLAALAVTGSSISAATCVVGLGPASIVVGPKLFKRFEASMVRSPVADGRPSSW